MMHRNKPVLAYKVPWMQCFTPRDKRVYYSYMKIKKYTDIVSDTGWVVYK